MSRHEHCCERPGFMGGIFSNNILNLIIFVLIVLQFGKRDEDHEDGRRDDNEIDNSILFVIALFFLFVCSCGNRDFC